MKAFSLSLDTLVLRFYLIMALVIVAGFSGIWPVALLALPVFLSCMWGLSINVSSKRSKSISHSRRTQISSIHLLQHQSV